MNTRVELQKISPELEKIGINCFASYRNKTPERSLESHDHGPCFEICYLESGNQPYYVRKENGETEKFDVCGGEIFITKPFEVHSTGNFNQLRSSLIWIQINSECDNLLGQCRERSEMLVSALYGIKTHLIKCPHSVSSKFTEAFDLMLIPDENRRFRATELLSLFVLELSEIGAGITGVTGTSRATLEAVSFVKSHLFSPALDVNAVAEIMNYSRSFAMRLFKKETGFPIHEFILKSKIELAETLLSDHSVIETAMLLNFSSSQHFSEVFKGFTGRSPAKFREEKNAKYQDTRTHNRS